MLTLCTEHCEDYFAQASLHTLKCLGYQSRLKEHFLAANIVTEGTSLRETQYKHNVDGRFHNSRNMTRDKNNANVYPEYPARTTRGCQVPGENRPNLSTLYDGLPTSSNPHVVLSTLALLAAPQAWTGFVRVGCSLYIDSGELSLHSTIDGMYSFFTL